MRLKHIPYPQTALFFAAGFLLAAIGSNTCQAFLTYSGGTDGGCIDCHGDFRGSTSTKGTVFPSAKNHEMHRASTSMATACNLCHISTATRYPVTIGISAGTANNAGVGCTGCHEPAGLRKHHKINGATLCYDCHDPLETPQTENTRPPYYGTVDTKANDPANTVMAANTNENWSVGDFLGLDNDGNDLYDLADYAVGPYRILGVTREGNDMRVTWQTAGGRTNILQAADSVSGLYTNVGVSLKIQGIGLVTTNSLEVGGATNLARFYKMKAVVP